MVSVGRYLRRALPAAVVLFALACAAPAGAQTYSDGRWHNGVTEAWWFAPETEPGAPGATARWEAVGEAARTTTGNAWAGDYFIGGSTHGTYLRWSPGGGFVIARVNKCAAQVMGLTHGRAEFTPSLVRFIPEFDVQVGAHSHGHGATTRQPPAELRFVPVEWDGRRLLVLEEEMDDFGDYLAGLGRYNDWDVYHFLGYTEFFTQFDGPEGGDGGGGPAASPKRPNVPPGYERFLKRPVEATVTAVGRSRVERDYTDEGANRSTTYQLAHLTHVTVNVGTDHGVSAGMLLRVSEPDESGEVRVVSAGRQSSEGVVVYDLDDDDGSAAPTGQAGEREDPSPVRVGWRLTTSPF